MSIIPRILRQPNPNFRGHGRPGPGTQQRVVVDPGRSAIAGKYFLSDVPGAAVPASRLSTVLENIERGKQLSAAALEYLRQRGYAALVGLATGESSYEEFSIPARAEQEKREAATADARRKEEAERLRAIAESAAREAARTAEFERQRRIRESDPKYLAKVKNQGLRAKYGLDRFIEKESFNRLMGILHRIDGGARFSDDDVLWLTTEGSEYYSDELRFEFHAREAEFFAAEFARSRDPWNAVNASGHFRKCDRSGAAHELLESVAADALKTHKLKSAVRTTHGGVMRDLGQFDEALRYGTEAHAKRTGNSDRVRCLERPISTWATTIPSGIGTPKRRPGARASARSTTNFAASTCVPTNRKGTKSGRSSSGKIQSGTSGPTASGNFRPVGWLETPA